MIPESEWRCCAAPGCGQSIKPHRKEGRGQYALRRYCNRKCASVYKFKPVELRKCGNPDCQNLVPRDPGMKPCDYARRKSCSPPCARRVMYFSALVRKPTVQKPRTERTPTQPKSKPQPIIALDEAEAIAAFIEQRGITYCPPKYVAVTLNAALPDSEATKAIRRIQINHMDGSWKGGSKRSWQRVQSRLSI